jgi:Leucine-rich repeat (LRR) protein
MLTELDLSSNRISVIEVGAFDGIPPESLDLSYNQISVINAGAFNSLVGAYGHGATLNLSHNQISQINAGDLSGASVNSLNLSYNQLTMVPTLNFTPNSTLHNLDLSSNSISQISTSLFSGFSCAYGCLKLENQRIDRVGVLTPFDTPVEVDGGAVIGGYPSDSENLTYDYSTKKYTLTADSGYAIWSTGFLVGSSPSYVKFSGTLRAYNSLTPPSITFVDTNFKKCVNNWLGRSANVDVTALDAATVTELVCPNRSINSLSDLQYFKNATNLDFSKNLITAIPQNTFDGFTSLNRLDLSGNQIDSIDSGAFSGIEGLIQLDLSNNEITTIEVGAFTDVDIPGVLDLSNNKITELLPNTFANLEVIALSLQGNSIVNLSAGAFDGLHVWNAFNLSRNLISRIDTEVFNNMTAGSLFLQGNSITELSAGVFENMSFGELDLRANQISSIHAGVFKSANISSLYLQNNQVSEIESFAFKNARINTLYLNNNLISKISLRAFEGLSVITLDLQSNKLDVIDSGTFEGLKTDSETVRMDLSSNSISAIEADAFDGLTLYDLDLSNNLITRLSKGAFKGLRATNEWDVYDGRLHLNSNLISEIEEGAFGGISNFKLLDLEHNQLDENDLGTLGIFSLGSSWTMNLKGNHVAEVTRDTFGGSAGLQVVQLENQQVDRYSVVSPFSSPIKVDDQPVSLTTLSNVENLGGGQYALTADVGTASWVQTFMSGIAAVTFAGSLTLHTGADPTPHPEPTFTPEPDTSPTVSPSVVPSTTPTPPEPIPGPSATPIPAPEQSSPQPTPSDTSSNEPSATEQNPTKTRPGENIIVQLPEADGPNYAFTDTKSLDNARRSDIGWLAQVKVTVGSGCVKVATGFGGKNCKYLPAQAVNRGAMAQFLQKLAGVTDATLENAFKNTTTKFQDISKLKTSNSSRYYAILWLADLGITSGCVADSSKFCPQNSVTRGAMGEFMQKFAGVENEPDTSSDFPDVSTKALSIKYDGTKKARKVSAASPARIGAINWLAEVGITKGSGAYKGQTTFRPQDAVNRGGMAQFMHRLYDWVKASGVV